jgi:ligand-binding sensor domain-containing protein
MIRDRNSNIWVGAPDGLTRIDGQGLSSLEKGESKSGRLSSGPVTALFEDREGNLWVGTRQGIERLRDSVFTTYAASAGLPGEINGPVYVDAQGRTWFAPSQGGLYWVKENQVGRVANASLGKDVIYSIGGNNQSTSGNQGELWIGRRGGLSQLRYGDNSFATRTYTTVDGLAQNVIFAVHQARDGTVWAGTLSGGVSSFKNGTFKTYTTANGLGSNSITAILETSDRSMWFGTPNGLNVLSNGRWRIYTSRDGLPPGTVNCLSEDSSGTIWVGTANGVGSSVRERFEPRAKCRNRCTNKSLELRKTRPARCGWQPRITFYGLIVTRCCETRSVTRTYASLVWLTVSVARKA